LSAPGGQLPDPPGISASARSLKPIVVLISGRGSNMRALAEHARSPRSCYRVALVLSDKPQAAGLGVARSEGLATDCLSPADHGERAAFDRALAARIDAEAPALIVLAGFMRILSSEFVERYADRLLNIHPSLLPLHPGLHTHRRVLAAGEKMHGATVHFVTAELDGGAPILQARVDVLPGDDEHTLAARVQAEEHKIYPLVVDWFCSGRLQHRDGRAWLDGAALEGPLRYDERLSKGML